MKITQQKGAARTPWSEEEITAVIKLYAEFLKAQRAGEKYSKAPRVRALAEQIGRSKGSIEAKLMNVSGARALEGKEVVIGYKPLKNAQRLLITMVKASQLMGLQAAVVYLSTHPLASVLRLAA